MIVLCTDFGLAGPYTGQVKAVLARLAPQLPVVDLFADLPAFAPQLAAYLLAAYLQPFEPGDVIAAVVDPGVGGTRRALVVEADGLWLTGPDNGLFEPTLRRARAWRAWSIDVPAHGIAPTFHGRDVFAPAAARLALGDLPQGPQVEPVRFPVWPDDLPAIAYVDRYGNAMTGLRAATLAQGTVLEVAGRRLVRRRIFADVPAGEAMWYENANGLAEIAVHGGSAAATFGLAPGSPVAVRARA
ncbi:MAG TPA: SAM-dependent chlorinase/fluorinase [Geminicoccaceae bacterium]|nr:SAM-dependent chlorinase/fluorinase [Geminicoccaceae bacterium]